MRFFRRTFLRWITPHLFQAITTKKKRKFLNGKSSILPIFSRLSDHRYYGGAHCDTNLNTLSLLICNIFVYFFHRSSFHSFKVNDFHENLYKSIFAINQVGHHTQRHVREFAFITVHNDLSTTIYIVIYCVLDSTKPLRIL